MAAFSDDRDRQIVPRWRSFAAAIRFGEVAPTKIRPAGAFNATMLEPVLEDWRRQRTLSVACDVISAAFAIGCKDAARDAAEFVLSSDTPTHAAIDVAKRCLAVAEVGPGPQFVQNYGQPPDVQGIREAVRRGRRRLAEFPNNPVLWTNLALHFTTLGEQQKAERAMKVALALAPNNRFVLRAGSRLFLHLGDLDRAHSILSQAALVQTDPWILASEVATAAARKQPSRFVKRARSIIESQNFSPFHLSELTGALATLEADGGNPKKAKRLCSQSLVDPAENAIAQVAWLSRQERREDWLQQQSTGLQSSEANAWVAARKGDWSLALEEARRWQGDQPFSSRPAQLGSFVAATALESFDEAERIVNRGLLSNRDDSVLHNNLAFVLACEGRLGEARQALNQAKLKATTKRERVCLTATEGLLEFRSGHRTAGRLRYMSAIALANDPALDEIGNIALIYFALEELRIRSDNAAALKKQALAAAAKLAEPLRVVFLGKLLRDAPALQDHVV